MKNTMNWNFNNSYSKLPNTFKEHIEPVAVKNPEIVLSKIFNEAAHKDSIFIIGIDHYKENEDIALNLANKAYNIAVKNHTWKARMKTFLSNINVIHEK